MAEFVKSTCEGCGAPIEPVEHEWRYCTHCLRPYRLARDSASQFWLEYGKYIKDHVEFDHRVQLQTVRAEAQKTRQTVAQQGGQTRVHVTQDGNQTREKIDDQQKKEESAQVLLALVTLRGQKVQELDKKKAELKEFTAITQPGEHTRKRIEDLQWEIADIEREIKELDRKINPDHVPLQRPKPSSSSSDGTWGVVMLIIVVIVIIALAGKCSGDSAALFSLLPPLLF
jgi:hypothetical protein